jgi:uncharacterized protein YqeY
LDSDDVLSRLSRSEFQAVLCLQKTLKERRELQAQFEAAKRENDLAKMDQLASEIAKRLKCHL